MLRLGASQHNWFSGWRYLPRKFLGWNEHEWHSASFFHSYKYGWPSSIPFCPISSSTVIGRGCTLGPIVQSAYPTTAAAVVAPPLPRSRPQKLGNGRPPEVVYIPQARFTSLSLSLRRFWSISNSPTAMKRSSFYSYIFVLHDAENRMPKFEIL